MIVCEVTETASASIRNINLYVYDVQIFSFLKLKKVLWSCMVAYLVILVFADHAVITITWAA